MSRYSKIDRRIWNDAKFRSLSKLQPCGQGLFLYLLTNPSVGSIPGVYSAGERGLAEALGWELEAFREAFQEALSEGLVKADFEARLIWIPNAIRYNEPESYNVVKSWRCPWDELPECPLKREAWEGLRGALVAKDIAAENNEAAWVNTFLLSCPEPSPNGCAKGMPKRSGKPSAKAMANQEQEPLQEQEQEQFKTIAHSENEREGDVSSDVPVEWNTDPTEAAKPPNSANPATEGHRRIAKRAALAAETYAKYPRKVAKADALKAIEKAIVLVSKRGTAGPQGDDDAAALWLGARADLYAKSAQAQQADKSKIPYPATWFNKGRYDDCETEWAHVGISAVGRRIQQPSQSFADTDYRAGFEDVLSRPTPAWNDGGEN